MSQEMNRSVFYSVRAIVVVCLVYL